MVEKKPLDDAELDGLFAAAQDVAPEPSEAFMARILSDAMAEMPAAPVLASPAVAVAEPGWLASLMSAIGGWPAAAGLATATVAGLMIGFATPDTLDDWTGGYLATDIGYQVEDWLPSYDDLLGEG